MNYSNRVTLHDYYSSFIHYFSIYFSLFSTFSSSQLFLSTVCSLLTLTSLSFHLSLSPPISPQAHRFHSHRSHSLPIQPQQANNAMAELRNTVAEFRWYDLTRTRPRNDTVVELLGTWCVGFDGYWSGRWWLGFWWVGWIFYSVGFDLDRLVFSSSLVGFDDLAADWVGDDLAWLGLGLGEWLMGFGLNGFWIEWVGFS